MRLTAQRVDDLLLGRGQPVKRVHGEYLLHLFHQLQFFLSAAQHQARIAVGSLRLARRALCAHPQGALSRQPANQSISDGPSSRQGLGTGGKDDGEGKGVELECELRGVRKARITHACADRVGRS